MPAGSIERTTCYGKRLRIVRSLFRIRKMPADRGQHRSRGRPCRAGLPQARGPQALKLRGNRGFASQRPAGLGRTETPLRRPAAMSFPDVKKPRSELRGFFTGVLRNSRFAVDQFDALPGPRAAEYRPAEEPEFLADRAVQAQVEDRVHQLFGKCRGVDFGQ